MTGADIGGLMGDECVMTSAQQAAKYENCL